MTLFPTEMEQIEAIDEYFQTESSAHSVFSFPQRDIDTVLRQSIPADGRMEIYNEFAKGKSVDEIAQFLQKEYAGGRGFATGTGKFAVWFDEEGIKLAWGTAARYENVAQTLAWTDAAERIGSLLEAGQFLTNVEAEEAHGHELRQTAEKLWVLHQNFSDEARKEYFSPALWEGGFPDSTARIADLLGNPETMPILFDEFSRFLGDFRRNPDLLRSERLAPNEVLAVMMDLLRERRELPSSLTELPPASPFISDDQIDDVLTRHPTEHGKDQIYAYCTQVKKPELSGLAMALRVSYGTGGRMPGLLGVRDSREQHDRKELCISQGGCEDVRLSWNKVARRVEALIEKDRYLTPEEKRHFAEMVRNEKIRDEMAPYSNLKLHNPDDMVLFQMEDSYVMFRTDARAAANLLGLSLSNRNIPGAGWVEVSEFPVHRLEENVEKLRERYDVTVSSKPDAGAARQTFRFLSAAHEAALDNDFLTIHERAAQHSSENGTAVETERAEDDPLARQAVDDMAETDDSEGTLTVETGINTPDAETQGAEPGNSPAEEETGGQTEP